MNIQLTIATLLSTAAWAQTTGPAVKILLMVDPPPASTPALEIAPVNAALNGFAKSEGFVRPPDDGDGRILATRIEAKQRPGGLWIAAAVTRLSVMAGGKVRAEGSTETHALVMSTDQGALWRAMGRELVRTSTDLLVKADVIPSRKSSTAVDLPKPAFDADHPKAIKFMDASVASAARQPPYPSDARGQHVQGKVVLQVVVDPEGKPASAAVLEGPGRLMEYAETWLMTWRFKPVLDGKTPIWATFPVLMDFRLR